MDAKWLTLRRASLTQSCENSEGHCDAAVSVQTAQRCCNTLCIAEYVLGTMMGLQEEGPYICINWLANWKTGINLCFFYKQKLISWFFLYTEGLLCYTYSICVYIHICLAE